MGLFNHMYEDESEACREKGFYCILMRLLEFPRIIGLLEQGVGGYDLLSIGLVP